MESKMQLIVMECVSPSAVKTGGVAGLVGAWMIGPRLGRFNGSEVKPIVGHNVESIALGTFLLWMGWCGPFGFRV